MAEAAHAQPAWVLLAYLIAGVCFILALRGLSSPESSRRGNYTGMVGMAIAAATTLITHFPMENPKVAIEYLPGPNWINAGMILVAIAVGGGIGLITARKIQMTA